MADQKVKAKKDYIDGMKYKDLATKYGVTVDTVKSWVKRYKWAEDKKRVQSKGVQRKGTIKPRISAEKKEEVIALASLGNSKRSIAEYVGIARVSVDSIVNANKDELQQYREAKKREFIDNSWQSINNALLCANQKILVATQTADALNTNIERFIQALENSEADYKTIAEVTKALSNNMNIPLRDIATFIGTIYDKVALASGQSTQNINANVKTEVSNATSNVDYSKMSTEDLMAQLELLENG